MQLVLFFSLLSLVLGGFIFPRYTMPPVLQAIGNLFPLTYFVPITRGIVTKGIGPQFLVVEIVALVVYILVIMALVSRAFRQRLD
jgi:ABC-2 type transport system permease protein